MYGIIYKITNKINNKVYIGQTIHTVRRRYDGSIEHTKNRHLKRAILEYGISAFEIEEPLDTAETKEELDRKEQYYIELFKSNDKNFGYNIMSGGHNGRHSEETKELIRKAQVGELNHNYGKRGKLSKNYTRVSSSCEYCGKPIEILNCYTRRNKHNFCSPKCARSYTKGVERPETWKRVKVVCDGCGETFEVRPSESTGQKYFYCSKECQNKHYKKIFTGKNNPNYGNHKVAGSNNGRAKKVLCVTTGETFGCAIDAGKKYGIKRGLIPAACRGRQKTAGGMEWKYL